MVDTVSLATEEITSSSTLQPTFGPEDTFNPHNNLFGLIMPADFLSIVYATTVAIGGVIGFATKGSIPSLVAGLGFGAVLGFGAYQTSANPKNYYLLLGTSAALATMMGFRFYKSGKFMPAGLIFSLASFMVLRFGLRFVTGRNYF